MADHDQRTDAWFAARAGRVTASRIADVMAKTKTGFGASRATYMAQLVCERITGKAAESFTNAAMQWGTDTEPLARDAYCVKTGALVDEDGFVPHPRIANSGASPDGLVGTDGLIEIKCPSTSTHIETLLGEPIPLKYIYQMQWQMVCTNRMWCDFVSFDPRMPAHLQLFIKRIFREDALLDLIEKEVVAFLEEVDQKVFQLNQLEQA